MIHPDIQNNLLAYLDGALTPAEETAVRDHLAGCDDCRAELASMQRFVNRLTGSLAETAARVEPSPQAWPSIQHRVARLGRFTAPFQGEFRLSRSLRVFSLALAALAIIAFVGLVIIRPLIGLPASEPTLTATSDMVEPTADPNETPGPAPTAEVYPFYQLNPTSLPAGLTYRIDVMDEAGQITRTLFYNKTDSRFLLVVQRPGVYFSSIPSGDPTPLGALEAYINTNVQVSDTVGGQPVNWDDAISLTYSTPFATRVIIFTNLPAADLVDFAGTLVVDRGYFEPNPYPSRMEFSKGEVGNIAGMSAREDRYYNSSSQFVIFTQQAYLVGEMLAGGELITINGQDAVLYRDQSGTAPAAEGDFFNGMERVTLGGGGGGSGGGGGGGGGSAPSEPASIPYTDGLRIEWVQDGIRLNVLTNLSESEAVAFAETLKLHPPTVLATGAVIDFDLLPDDGGALAGYVLQQPTLPESFYTSLHLIVTEGDGLLFENRFYGNDQFVITFSAKDNGQPLPSAQGVDVHGLPAVMETNVSGEALLTSTILQDGIPRLLLGSGGGGGGGYPDDFVMLFPNSIPYTDATRISWKDQGARIWLLTNLPADQALSLAQDITVLGKEYNFIVPGSTHQQGQIFAAGYDLYAPTYVPAGLDNIYLSSDTEGQPDLVYANFETGSQFIQIRQRQAQPGETLPPGEQHPILGVPASVSIADQTGTLQLSPYMQPPSVPYQNGSRITLILGNSYIEILASYSFSDAVAFAESLIRAR